MGIAVQALPAMLSRLKLTALRDQLDSLLDQAARQELSLREALAFLCQAEIARKDQRRIAHGDQHRQVPLRSHPGRLRVSGPTLGGPQANPGVGPGTLDPQRG